MDLSTAVLCGMVVVLGSNYFLVRVPRWERRPGIFWSIQLLNVLAACWMVTIGIPELHGDAAMANWFLALLFVYHVIQNNGRWTTARRVKDDDALDERKAEFERALEAGRAEARENINAGKTDPPS